MVSTDALFGAGCALVTSLLSGAVVFGIMKTKLTRVESDLEKHEDHCEQERDRIEQRYVTRSEYQAETKAMRRSLETLERDVKEILKAVRH